MNFSWTPSTWTFKFLLSPKLLWHSSHLYGFNFWWTVLICLAICPLLLKVLLHIWQVLLNGSWWFLMCCLSWRELLNLSLQILQSKSTSIMQLCCFSFKGVLNGVLQISQRILSTFRENFLLCWLCLVYIINLTQQKKVQLLISFSTQKWTCHFQHYLKSF